MPRLKMDSRTRLVLPLPDPTQLSGSVLAKPKSHILTWQSALMRMLAGLMSL